MMTDAQLLDLHTLKTKTQLTWNEISTKLNKPESTLRKTFRRTNWKSILSKTAKIEKSEITKEVSDLLLIDNLVKGLIDFSRHDLNRLKETTKDQFTNSISYKKSLPISFTELKQKALYTLEHLGGFCYPSSLVEGQGTYIITGDCHGVHTRSGIFRLLKNLNDHISADKIIHIGHFLDDDNAINCNWEKFSNLTIIAKEEELKLLTEYNLPHNIVRKEIVLGSNLSIQNQDLIDDYSQTPLKTNITPEFFVSSTITNLHRHEFYTRCSEEKSFNIVASPGCLCDQHIVKTIKQQDFTDGRTVKITFPSGYKKYRRMSHKMNTWQTGLIVVHIDSDGNFHPIMCRIHQTSKGFSLSYFDKIITEKGIFDPEVKTIINSDLHADKHDPKVLDIQEQVSLYYKPDNYVNLGDLSNNESINHHVFKKNNSHRLDKSLLDESYVSHVILDKLSNWADKSYLIMGNHERFGQDMIDQYPQFKELLDFKFINGLSESNIEITELAELKKLSGVNYIHGEIKMFNQTGTNVLDKILRTYGRNTVMGHCHYSSCRGDCYTVGLSGKMDQGYNETNATAWNQGFAIANTFEGIAFITNLCVINYKFLIDHKMFTPENESEWVINNKYRAKIVFEQI